MRIRSLMKATASASILLFTMTATGTLSYAASTEHANDPMTETAPTLETSTPETAPQQATSTPETAPQQAESQDLEVSSTPNPEAQQTGNPALRSNNPVLAKINSINFTWIVRAEDIAVGAAVNANTSNLEYRWLQYDVSNRKWSAISEWTTGNWASWRSTPGVYWLHLEVRDPNNHEIVGTKTIPFQYAAGTTRITGTYAGWQGSSVLLGQSSNNPNAKFVIKIYDVNRRTWVQQFEGQWASWYPEEGTYWTHYEVYTSDWRLADTHTYTFGVSKVVSGNRELDAILQDLRYRYPTLESAYTYLVRNFRYIGTHGRWFPQGYFQYQYALDFFRNGGGNCYAFASAFMWMARSLGYETANVRFGYADKTLSAPHGWVEIPMYGTTYIFDPDLDMADLARSGGKAFYFKTYNTAPVYYHDTNGRPLWG